MFIHPGLGKTGTTAFQNNFLASSPYIHSCGRPYHGTHDYRKVCWMLTKAEDFELDQPFLKKWFQDQKSIAASKGKIPVLSDETLCGKGGGHRQLSVLFERIARFCPECHIVITIRNQVDLIKSFWFGHASHLKDVPIPHKGKYVSFDNWLNWQFNEYQSNQGQLLLYDFSRLESIIKHHIPKGSISFVPYETLPEFNQKNYSAIMSRILGVSGKELSEAMQIRTNCSSNRTNPYFKKIKNLTQIIPAFARKRKMLILVAQKIAAIFWKAKPEEYCDEHIRKIIDIYGQGNRMLSRRHSLELKERGYPWPGPIN